jgi:hypothetical protein
MMPFFELTITIVVKSILEEVRVPEKYLLKMCKIENSCRTQLVILFIQCTSVKKCTIKCTIHISVEKMKQDVDYTYQKTTAYIPICMDISINQF